MERREQGERERGRVRTGGNGVETGRARERVARVAMGSRGRKGGEEAILTKQRAQQAVSSFSG